MRNDVSDTLPEVVDEVEQWLRSPSTPRDVAAPRVGVISPVVVVASLLLVAWISYAFTVWFLVVVAVALAWEAVQFARGLHPALITMDARPADARADAELIAMVEDLAATAGIDCPETYISDEPIPNAFAVQTRMGGIVAVTRRLYQALPEAEMRAVMAHEIGHLQNRDTGWTFAGRVLMRTAIIVFGVLATALFPVLKVVSGGEVTYRGMQNSVGKLGLILGVSVHGLVSRHRESMADVSAAHLTGDPVSLAVALETLQDIAFDPWPTTPLRALASPQLLVNPFSGTRVSRWADTHPDTRARVRRLSSMVAPDMRRAAESTLRRAAEARGFRRDHHEWQRVRTTVQVLQAAATDLLPRPATPAERQMFALRKADLVYEVMPADLLQVRSSRGVKRLTPTQSGFVCISTRGYEFVGAKKVKAYFASTWERQWLQHEGRDALVVREGRRVNPIGFAFADASVRLVDLVAQADSRGERPALRRRFTSLARQVQRAEPTPSPEIHPLLQQVPLGERARLKSLYRRTLEPAV